MLRTSSAIKSFADKGLALLLCLFAGMAVAQPAAEGPASKNKGDLRGDALPDGALARFGTVRWRHADTVTFTAFLPDGKAILTAGQDNTVRLWDRETGRELRHFALPAANTLPAQKKGLVARSVNIWGLINQNVPIVALSMDGKTLAAAVGGNTIQLWEVASGKELRKLNTPQTGAAMLTFTHDDKALAVIAGDRTAAILDVESGKEIYAIRPKQPMPGAVRVLVGGFINNGGNTVALSHDAKLLASAENEFDQALMMVKAYVKLTDVANNNELRRIDMPQTGASAVTFSPDNKILAFANQNTIEFRDPGTGKEIRQFNAGSPVNILVFAPNGKTVAARGLDQIVRLFDAETGKQLHQLGEAMAQGGRNTALVRFAAVMGSRHDLAFSADGKAIVTGSDNTVRLWDAATGKELPLTDGHRGPVSTISISADGKTLISRGADNTICRWDAVTSKRLSSFREPQGTTCVAVSPDGRSIAFGAGPNIRLHDTTTGAEIKQVEPGHANGTATLVFSPDGKTLASFGLGDSTIRLHDLAQGRALRQIALRTEEAPANPSALIIRGGYVGGPAVTLAFTPDSRSLVALWAAAGQPVMRVINGQPQMAPAAGSTIRMWDVATAKEIRKILLPQNRGLGSMAVSPDSRILATENPDQTVSLWEIASGKERARLGQPDAAPPANPASTMVFAGGGFGMVRPTTAASTLAFSPDGTTLACKGADNSVRVWEIVHAKEIGSFKGHGSAVATLAYTPDGKALATGSADSTILVWNVASLNREPALAAIELQAAETSSLWSGLIDDDAGKAFAAILKLGRAPKQTVPLLAEQIKPAVPADPKKLAKLISELDSEEFELRSNAAEELEKLGDLAVPTLEQVLKGQPTLESRRRVEQLLARLTGGNLTPEQIRVVRAIEALERAGTQEARQLLQSLAGGAPGALPTRMAQDVLARTAK